MILEAALCLHEIHTNLLLSDSMQNQNIQDKNENILYF